MYLHTYIYIYINRWFHMQIIIIFAIFIYFYSAYPRLGGLYILCIWVVCVFYAYGWSVYFMHMGGLYVLCIWVVCMFYAYSFSSHYKCIMYSCIHTSIYLFCIYIYRCIFLSRPKHIYTDISISIYIQMHGHMYS
jgi:hypothetical protein